MKTYSLVLPAPECYEMDYGLLVSNSTVFIFLETQKAAGTSVAFFQEYRSSHATSYSVGKEQRKSEVSSLGVVGALGITNVESKLGFCKHMPDRELREKLGAGFWEHIFKFTLCRNPFDVLVSQFWWINQSLRDEMLKMSNKEIHSRFRYWLRENEINPNSRTYLINGVPAVDYFIRYERLAQGVKFVCDRLGIEKNFSLLQIFKSGVRPKN